MTSMSEIVSSLNSAQAAAVTAPECHMLVLAGAGSGKTRVLVHRIAYLCEHYGISPYEILAVTFTNKAAHEMRNRIEDLLQIPVRGMKVGTFHGIAHQLLRAHWQEAGLPETFQILDSDDQYRVIRRVLASLHLDEDQWPPKQVQWFINQKKDEGLRPNQIKETPDMYTKTLLRVYTAYEEACARGGMIDFAELLLRAYELWQKSPATLQHYQTRFRHILVDEFQDTNTIQYAWLRQLIGSNNFMTIVGDDDQSIYGWRGAKIENIQRFTEDFPNSQVVRLEQNYRSTGTILAAANALINHNDERLGKSLWTSDGAGEPISLYAGFNDLDEARFIVERIREAINSGSMTRKEIAILYRSNAQSRVLEEALIQQGIPYRIYGGLRFFDRAEIKDTLGYLRLIANRNDDAAFERVVNTPTRGIGDQTLITLRELARAQQLSLWQASDVLLQTNTLTTRAINALTNFLQLIERLSTETADLDLAEQTEHVIQHSGLWAHFSKEKGEKGRARLENLEELITATRQFIPPENSELPVLTEFLAHAALEAGENQADQFTDCVQLMTLHTAKGLEFPLVFLCGVEEGLFPHAMSLEEPGRLAEERRLCYVGITRAMHKLFITYAEVRRLHGSEAYHRPSRFIREIPSELIKEVRMRANVNRVSTRHDSTEHSSISFNQDESHDGLKLGQRVHHAKFGEGVITSFEGQGPHMRIQVKFAREGSKWLVASYAKLEPV